MGRGQRPSSGSQRAPGPSPGSAGARTPAARSRSFSRPLVDGLRQEGQSARRRHRRRPAVEKALREGASFRPSAAVQSPRSELKPPPLTLDI